MALLGGADEVGVGDIETFPGLHKQRSDVVSKLLRRNAGGIGRLLNLETMLIGACEEVNFFAEESMPPSKCVADDCCVRVPEMGLRVHVIDRCRQIEATHALQAIGTDT